MNILTTGFNFSQDGPGNRLVIHTQGCNFHCPWCSNPESMEICTQRREMTPEEIVHLAKRSEMMFFSGGGVTFTGGEATLQFDQLRQCLALLREASIHTCLETNGSHPRLTELAPLIDYLIVDCKLADGERHRWYTGNDGEQTRENIRKLTQSGKDILVRIPLINHINTDPAPFVAFFGTCDRSHLQVEILPYHEYGRDKWEKPYTVTDGFVSAAQIDAFAQALRADGIQLIQT